MTGSLRTSVRAAVAALVAATVLAVAAPPAAAATPTLTVTPSTGLVDEQRVTVEGSGWRPGALVAVLMCDADDTGDAGCDYGTSKDGRVEADGTFSLVFQVERVLDPKGQEPFDCAERPDACAVVAFDVEQFDRRAVAPVSFDPAVPLPHPLRVTVKVRRVGFVRETGHAVVTGTVSCNRDVGAGIGVQLVQDEPDVIGDGVTSIRECGEDVPWRVVVVPRDGGTFAPQRAAGTVRALATDGDEAADDVEVVYVDLSR